MNNNGGSRFFDGFLLGVIIGALAFYLFGTKSGKRIVKIMSEQGLEGIQNLMEDLKDAQEENELGEEPDLGEEKISATKVIVEKPKKRFFRRFKRVD
jgi:gas vesicle protein